MTVRYETSYDLQEEIRKLVLWDSRRLAHHVRMARDVIRSRRDNFVAWMTAMGLKVPDVARASGVPKTTIYSYVDPKKDASLLGRQEAAIAEAYDLPIEGIFGGGGARDPNHIGAWRESCKITPAEFAQKLGTSLAVVELLEAGDVTLSSKWLRRIGDALGVRPGYLLEDPASITGEVLERFARIPEADRPQALRVLDALGGGAA